MAYTLLAESGDYFIDFILSLYKQVGGLQSGAVVHQRVLENTTQPKINTTNRSVCRTSQSSQYV